VSALSRLRSRASLALARHLRVWPRSLRTVGLAVVLAALTSLPLQTFRVLEPVEFGAFDAMVSRLPDIGRDPRLTVIGITEADIEKYGFPLSDAKVARLVELLQAHSPQVIGVDLYRHAAHPPGRAALREQFAAPNVIAVRFVGMDPDVGEVPAPAFVPPARIGFNDFVLDPDGVVRRALVFVGSEQRQYFSFALRVAIAYFDATLGGEVFRFDEAALSLRGHRIPRLMPWFGGYADIDNAGYQTMLRFRSREAPAELLSLDDVYLGRYDPEQLSGRAILIGAVAPSLNHLFFTPYSPRMEAQFLMPGVLLHAQIVSQLLDTGSGAAGLYTAPPPALETTWLLAWALLTALIIWQAQGSLSWLLAGLALPVALMGSVWMALSSRIWLPVAAPVVAMAVSAVAVAVQRYLYRTRYDGMTGLPTRQAFLRHVARSLEASGARPCTIAVMDIDRFDMVNKTLGHATGDRVLAQIAARLAEELGDGGVLARTGGDEFSVAFDTEVYATVERSLENMRRALAQPLQAGQYRLSFTMSVGLARSWGATGRSPGALFRDAHTAMYRAKVMRSASNELFSDDMREEASVRLALESDLNAALENDEFFLAYQPIVDITSGRIVGFETLLRWHSPTRGLVPPAQFIPVVEETGMIIPLGDWILSTASRQARAWLDRFPDQPLTVNVNLSRRQLDRGDLAAKLVRILDELDLPPASLQLEVTESMVMRNPEAARALLLDLRRLGLAIAIDDFGTGYSSLSYLHRFPADTLKIDRSFVCRMESSPEDKIIETIMALGRKLGMKLVAEGVETERQCHLLGAAGCDLAQGYLFSPPLPAEEATRLLADRAPLSAGRLP
jgi:diguanylate cyclase (GGDEF)-like protein